MDDFMCLARRFNAENLFTYAEGSKVRVSLCILLKENQCLKAKLIEIKFIQYFAMHACIEFKIGQISVSLVGNAFATPQPAVLTTRIAF